MTTTYPQESGITAAGDARPRRASAVALAGGALLVAVALSMHLRGGVDVVDEVGYIPFEPEAANLFFQMVSSATNEPR